MELNRKLSQKRQRELIEITEMELKDITFPALNDDTKPIATLIIKEISFLYVTLHRLKYDVIKTDIRTVVKNGAQEYEKENTSLKAYNNTISKYSSLLKELKALIESNLEAEQGKESLDLLGKFIQEGVNKIG